MPHDSRCASRHCARCAPLSNKRSISAPSAWRRRSCQLGELLLIRLDVGQQRFPVGQRDVAPHFRRAAGNSGEIAEAAGSETEQRFRIRPRRDHVHQRVGEHVRQVADCGEHAVVTFRRHSAHAGATGLPHRFDAIDCVGIVFLQRREHHVSAIEQACAGGVHAGQFGAGDRMSRHHGRKVRGQPVRRTAATKSCFVLPASVTSVPVPGSRRARPSTCSVLLHRHRDQNCVGALHRSAQCPRPPRRSRRVRARGRRWRGRGRRRQRAAPRRRA